MNCFAVILDIASYSTEKFFLINELWSHFSHFVFSILLSSEALKIIDIKGSFKCYVTQMGVGGGVKFSGKKRYKGVRFNVISITRGWVGVQLTDKKRYVTLEWPHRDKHIYAYDYIKQVYALDHFNNMLK